MNQTIFSENDLDPVTLGADKCRHKQVHVIGEDFDKHGRLLKLVRCTRCGLLMRTYLPNV
jgi:hypothetical protein